MKHALYATLLCTLCACSGNARLSPAWQTQAVQTIVVLPAEQPADVSREKVAAVRTAVAQELKSSGFTVLDDALVSAACTENGCTQQAQFAEKYGVHAFAQLDQISVSRINLLAGFYNSLGARVRLSDAAGKELAEITRAERERGGLLFNSGQVVEGLRSSASNTEDESFNRLSTLFAKSVVLALPTPKGVGQQAQVQITNVAIEPAGSGRYRVCAEGSKNNIAALLIGAQRAALKEQRPGNYCGVFPLGISTTEFSRAAVELRSPYGITAQREISMQMLTRCAPAGLAVRDDAGSVTLRCPAELDAQLCEQKLAACREATLLVYSAPGTAGPFTKVALKKSANTPALIVLGVTKNGDSSVPVILAQKKP